MLHTILILCAAFFRLKIEIGINSFEEVVGMYSERLSTFVSNPTMTNVLKEKSAAGEKSLGTFMELGGGGTIECLARGGFDYLIIDAEHGPFSVETTANHILAAEKSGITPLVRICEVSRSNILRMLDIGAKGIVIPNVNTVNQVREIVQYAKFAPIGQRGYCPTRTSCWGADDWAADGKAYMERCNHETLVIPQCETVGAYENIDEILAIEGVDGIFVGPCDLSIALGVPFEFDSAILKKAIVDVLNACKKANKFSFIFAGNVETAREYFALGFDSVTYSLDASIFAKACNQVVLSCKA